MELPKVVRKVEMRGAKMVDSMALLLVDSMVYKKGYQQVAKMVETLARRLAVSMAVTSAIC